MAMPRKSTVEELIASRKDILAAFVFRLSDEFKRRNCKSGNFADCADNRPLHPNDRGIHQLGADAWRESSGGCAHHPALAAQSSLLRGFPAAIAKEDRRGLRPHGWTRRLAPSNS